MRWYPVDFSSARRRPAPGASVAGSTPKAACARLAPRAKISVDGVIGRRACG
jgi:hypothetical protein